MPNQPKPENVPICFRPGVRPGDPDGDRAWLNKRAEQTGRAVGALVSEGVALLRAVTEGRITTAESSATTKPRSKVPHRCPVKGWCNVCGEQKGVK